MRKALVLLLAVCLLLSGCAQVEKGEDKLSVCATLFPQYDFARVIAGDKIELRLLLPAGLDSHSYEPSIRDVAYISFCDVFLFTGAAMEPWAERLLVNLPSSACVADLSRNIDKCTHQHDEGAEPHLHHNHSDEPHIWTSPRRAMIMVDNVVDALCETDKDNAEFYLSRAQDYKKELEELDRELTELGKLCEGITLCHGGKFSMAYLAEDYGIKFVAALDSCASEEPGVMRVKELIDAVERQRLQGVFYEELSSGRIADTVCSETGAEKLLLHSCHNLGRDELERGETYVSLMKKNIENIKRAIGVSR